MKEEQISFFEQDDSSDLEIKELKELQKKLEYYNKKYYEEDISEISDFEYDKLSLRFRELEKKYPNEITSSPTSKIGGKSKDIFTKVTHDVQMQSLQDVFSYDEVREFVEKVCAEYGDKTEFVVETKIDGLSVSLEYENGVLKRGSTRGDGNIGEDVTQNLKMISDIPHKLTTKDTIEVRGEVYLPRAEFEKINDELQKESKKVLSNPRNAAAGTLRQLDKELVKKRNLSIFIFNVQKGKEFVTHSESLDYLEKASLKVIELKKVCIGIDEVLAAIENIGNKRDSLLYDIDGAVVKVNNLKIREEMGKTVKVPKWAVAYKYPPERKETKILNIETQVGRTGQVTPLAILDSVRLAGSIISKATLHNFDYVKDMDIRIGDTCVIEKAGDVIPEVVDIVKSRRDGSQKEYVPPVNCPVCGEKLYRQDGEVALKCVNSECPAQIYRGVVHFVSRDAMNIIGFGESIVDLLIKKNLIFDVADIYYLKFEDIYSLEGFKEKSAQNLIDAIVASKSNPLSNLIFGLGINHIGKKAAKIIEKNFDNIDEISKASYEDLAKIEDIGDIMAESVYNFFRKDKTHEIIEKLRNAGVNLNSYKKEKLSDKLDGKKICITGTFDNYKRDEVASLIEDNGGKNVSSVSNKVDYLIAGESAGSKLSKANELGVKVITIEEFLNLIK